MSITATTIFAGNASDGGLSEVPAALRLNLIGGDLKEVPEWMRQLRDQGWCVVKGAVPRDRADHYRDEAYKWVEGWGLGYDRNDHSTRLTKNMPWSVRGGLYARYGVAHEQFIWDIKQEPGVVSTFEQIWNTEEIVASYDGFNLSVPMLDRPRTHVLNKPWPHADQSPLRPYFHCIQGIVNLAPNGPDDGGLMVLERSNLYYKELWEKFDHKKGPDGWHTWDQQNVDEEMCDWLVNEKGCKYVKVCAEPGDLLLWDSRTIHYGAQPTSQNDRVAAYVCYKPAAYLTDELKQIRKQCWDAKMGTTHDPTSFRTKDRLPPEDHPTFEEASKRSLQEPKLTKRGRQLAGVDLY